MTDGWTHTRRIYFRDTDAAGVVYFANLLAICHEAYEGALVASGIELRSFFSNSTTAIPIVHASVDFFRPLFCGDVVEVYLKPKISTPSEFEIAYTILKAESAKRKVAVALTRHVCIDPQQRCRQELPDEIMQWLQSAV